MTNKFEKSSFIILLITTILTPLAFIPSAYAPLDMVKTVVITLGILLSSILYFISTLKTKEISIPKSPLFIVSCLTIISVIISTIFSTSVSKSLFGQGFEFGTTSLILIMFLSSLLVVYLTNKNKERIMYVYGSIFVTFFIIALFQIARLFTGSEYLTLGFLQSLVSTVLGKWNDVAMLSGVVGSLSLITLRFFSVKTPVRIMLIIASLISAFFVFIINSSLVLSALFIVAVSFGIFEYFISTKDTAGVFGFVKKIPVVTLVISIILLVGVLKGDVLSSKINQKLNTQQNEVVLSWRYTTDIFADSIKESPLFGSGPNRFGSQYLKFKPVEINISNAWNLEFGSGFSTIATFAVTQGILGLLLWILLIVVFAYTGYCALKKSENDVSRFLISATFFPTLFLWIMSVIYVPSISIIFITFILSGLFVSALVMEGHIEMIKIGGDNSSIKKFIPVIILVIIAVSVLWFVVYAKKAIAQSYFHSGISLLNKSDALSLQKAETSFKTALSFDKNDTYYQALSEVNILKITALAQNTYTQAQKNGTAPDADALKQLGVMIDEAVGYTKEAIRMDPTNYYNYLAYARISSVGLSLTVPGSYDSTKEAYLKAAVYNPFDPSIYLSLAKVEASQNKMPEAQKYVVASLQLKQNYLDAVFLLSQIQIAQNQTKDAITSVKYASELNPNNQTIFFQLGFLYYNDKNYQGAIDALNKAIKIDNGYANAQYFLGLSYARINDIPNAIAQFEALAVSNPDSKEVKLILSNLKKGKSPFADAVAPIDSKPEKRSSLPVKEKVQIKNK